MQDFLSEFWDELRERWGNARRETALWMPRNAGAPWLAPAMALSGLLALVLLSGVAILSLGLLLTSLLAAYLILETVFGVTIEIDRQAPA